MNVPPAEEQVKICGIQRSHVNYRQLMFCHNAAVMKQAMWQSQGLGVSSAFACEQTFQVYLTKNFGLLRLFALVAVHWGVLEAHNALFIAASRIACILVAVMQLAVLSVLISPDIASERVRSAPSSRSDKVA